MEIEKEDESPQSKKAKTEAVPDRNKTTFRVSCKLAGKPSRVLTTLVSAGNRNEHFHSNYCLKSPQELSYVSVFKQDVCKCIGNILWVKYNWTVNLRNPTVEVSNCTNFELTISPVVN